MTVQTATGFREAGQDLTSERACQERTNGTAPNKVACQETVLGERQIKLEKEFDKVSNSFMRVDDVAEELGVSKSYAYKIVRKLNTELKAMGYLTVAGRVNKQYFMEKVCYGEQEKERG